MTINDTAKATAAEWLKGKLSARVLRLIALADWSLHCGPDMDGQDDGEDSEDGSLVKWSGFESACDEIRAAFDDLPGELWVDTQSDNVSESEPEADEYEDVNPDYDPEDEDSEEFVTVQVFPEWGDYRKFEGAELRRLVLGEMAEYV